VIVSIFTEICLIKAYSKCESEDLVKKGSDTNVSMRSHLYGEQTGPSQAARGSANGLTAYLEGVSFRGIERIRRVSHGMVIQWVRR
jgi:transposase-like protein